VPIAVAVDGQSFDGSADLFYERMREGAVATTSQPSPGAFLTAYERAAEDGAAAVLSLHLDRRVSGVAASAERAAEDAPVPVLVVDLPTVSFGVAVSVRAAAAALRRGESTAEAGEMARRTASTLDNVFVARAAPGGRVSASEEWAILRFADGTSHVLGHQSLVEHVVDDMLQLISARPGWAAVGHASHEVEPAADRLAHDLLRLETFDDVERYRVTPSVGAHTGPDSFGAFWRSRE